MYSLGEIVNLRSNGIEKIGTISSWKEEDTKIFYYLGEYNEWVLDSKIFSSILVKKYICISKIEILIGASDGKTDILPYQNSKSIILERGECLYSFFIPENFNTSFDIWVCRIYSRSTNLLIYRVYSPELEKALKEKLLIRYY